MIRGKLAKIWYDYGGGFYGLIAGATFVYLEWIDLVEDVARAGGILELFSGGVLIVMLDFMMDALMNGLSAMLWPMEWLERFGYWSVPLVVGVYGVFTLVRPHLESMLPKPEKDEDAALGGGDGTGLPGSADPTQTAAASRSGARNRPV